MRTPLESLLNIKRWKEDEAKNRFAVLLKELAMEEKRLAGFEEQYKAISKDLESDGDELINISEVVRLNEYLDHVLNRIHHQAKVIADKENQVEAARRALIEASKEKKVMEKLEEKKKDAINEEYRRKEQIRSDESAVTGHIRKKA